MMGLESVIMVTGTLYSVAVLALTLYTVWLNYKQAKAHDELMKLNNKVGLIVKHLRQDFDN